MPNGSGDGGCALEGGGERCQRAQRDELKLISSLKLSFEEQLQSQPFLQAVNSTVWPQQSLNWVDFVLPLPCSSKTHPWRTALSQLCPSDTLVSVTQIPSRKEAELQPKGISPLPVLFLWHFLHVYFKLPFLGWVLYKWEEEQKEKSSDLLEGEGLRKHLSQQEPWESTAVLKTFQWRGWKEFVCRTVGRKGHKQSQETPVVPIWEECVQEVCQKLRFL